MSSHSGSTQTPSPTNSDQRFIDKQMSGVVEAILIHAYAIANKGMTPNHQQIAAYADTVGEAALLQMIRRHPGASSTRAAVADDADLLRWVGLIGREAGR